MFSDFGGDASVDSAVNFAIVVEVSVVDGVGFPWSATAVGVDGATGFGVGCIGGVRASGTLMGVAVGVDV